MFPDATRLKETDDFGENCKKRKLKGRSAPVSAVFIIHIHKRAYITALSVPRKNVYQTQ